MTTPALESLLAEVEQAEYRFCHADNCKAYTGHWIYEESCDCGLVRSRTLLPMLGKVCRLMYKKLTDGYQKKMPMLRASNWEILDGEIESILSGGPHE